MPAVAAKAATGGEAGELVPDVTSTRSLCILRLSALGDVTHVLPVVNRIRAERPEVSFEKLTGGLKDRISFSPDAELQSVSFKNVGLGRADLAVFNTLSGAVLRQHEVEFDYRKPGEKRASRRRVPSLPPVG